jgi:nitrate reductase delta subunit
MVELKQLYEQAGFELTARELPDYLPVVLEYLSCRDLAEARGVLADCVQILTTIGRSLVARRSRYAAVLQALLVIAGKSPIDIDKVPPVNERMETLDREWAEQPAFDGIPSANGPATGAPAA